MAVSLSLAIVATQPPLVADAVTASLCQTDLYMICDAVTAKHKQGAEYSAAFTLSKAGPLRATVSIEGRQGHRAFEGICKPADLSVAHCEVISFDKSLTAGETGQLKLHRRDR